MDVVFYETRRGRKPAREYIDTLVAAGEASAVASYEHGFALLVDLGLGVTMPNARMINRRARLYELRFGDHRIAYIEHDGCIVLLRGWRKQSQKLDKLEEAGALSSAEDWRSRSPRRLSPRG